MNSLEKIAKIAGASYLIIFLIGIYANFFILQNLIVPDDAVTTANNIMGNNMSFRMAIVFFVLMVVFDLFVAWALYVLLKPVNKNLSLLTAWLRLVNSTIFAIAIFQLLNVQELLGGGNYLHVYDIGQLYAQAMISLKTFNNIWLIGLIFFGLHLFVLGYLIYKSGYIPKIIGVLLVIASVGYLVDSLANFILPNYSNFAPLFLMVVLIPGFIGELSFTFWLLIKRISVEHIEAYTRNLKKSSVF